MHWLNNENGALLSSLMVAMAFAQQIKDERKEKERAKSELKLAYDSSPMGLFEASPQGVVERADPALMAMLGESDATGWDISQHVDKQDWTQLVKQAAESIHPIDAVVEA